MNKRRNEFIEGTTYPIVREIVHRGFSFSGNNYRENSFSFACIVANTQGAASASSSFSRYSEFIL